MRGPRPPSASPLRLGNRHAREGRVHLHAFSPSTSTPRDAAMRVPTEFHPSMLLHMRIRSDVLSMHAYLSDVPACRPHEREMPISRAWSVEANCLPAVSEPLCHPIR